MENFFINKKWLIVEIKKTYFKKKSGVLLRFSLSKKTNLPAKRAF